MAKRPSERLEPARNLRAQSKKAFAAEIARRRADQQNPNNTLLSPDEIAGDYILQRGLFTTLGGRARNITIDDLRTFSAQVRHLKETAKKNKMLGGIKAKQVIDKSSADDIERARKQIHMANPIAYKAMTEGGGQGTALMVNFVTNASQDSEVRHHSVNVQFLDFGAAVASPERADKMAKFLCNGRLKFECSCGRFKYWYRYICTQAEVVCGRAENAFPKIRNPELKGISCKHGLRVMQTISGSAAFKNYLAKAIQKFRDDIEHTENVERVADQRKFEEERSNERWERRTIRTTDQRRRKTTTKSGKTYESGREAAKAKAVQKSLERAAKLGASREYQDARNGYATLVRLGVKTEAQAAKELARYAKKLGL